ncbi:carbon-nitrogen hydrolase [Cryphonectria parasitica EP155]|uniref:Carbon-nitrogen hydrolase n=1 Tax=Cryphonectria parasitica (strain ATCC 38755 / EP155) TaxID=660469 RepID=A0A9P4Y339_CRYP1|nr:carbon-nitrogen hydrolase [Cryphonectria parasitica EP155]KAF3766087.1 carbon-nitrogen hydrolase [Cryphonectria parasitica EP155]
MAIAAVGQICSTASMAHNLEQCRNLMKNAAEKGAKVIFFPEAADYIASSPEESLSLARTEAESPFVQSLQAAAQQYNIDVHVGIHVPVPVQPSSSPAGETSAVATNLATATTTTTTTATTTTKLLNRTIWISSSGGIDSSYSYDKIHLFDFGALRESKHTQAGTSLTPPFDSPVGRIGSLICFDLRFPEPALALAHPPSSSPSSPGRGWLPAHVLTYPSAFTVPTGQAHWESLLRARAIESQCWVVAAAQVGWHSGEQGRGRVSYGRSMVVDPWGRVKLALPCVKEEEKTGMVMEQDAIGALGLVNIDLAEWEGVRQRMPLIRRS